MGRCCAKSTQEEKRRGVQRQEERRKEKKETKENAQGKENRNGPCRRKHTKKDAYARCSSLQRPPSSLLKQMAQPRRRRESRRRAPQEQGACRRRWQLCPSVQTKWRHPARAQRQGNAQASAQYGPSFRLPSSLADASFVLARIASCSSGRSPASSAHLTDHPMLGDARGGGWA